MAATTTHGGRHAKSPGKLPQRYVYMCAVSGLLTGRQDLAEVAGDGGLGFFFVTSWTRILSHADCVKEPYRAPAGHLRSTHTGEE
jgi:hypothetical protein